MWRRYFKLVKLVPGKVIVQGYGTLDFSRDDVPVEVCKALYEADFEFLEITEEGKAALYGIGIKPTTPPFGHPSLQGGELSPVVVNQQQVASNRQPVDKPRRKTKKEEVED
jgi:hypothetical protein